MSKNRFLLLITVFGFQLLNAQPKVYPIDTWHSKIGFTAKLGSLIDVDGTFSDFDGTILYDENDLSTISATIFIETASIDTDVSMRDNHLRDEEFLNVEKYPYLFFQSNNTVKKGRTFVMSGNLEIKGTSKKVAIEFKRLHKVTPDPWGNNRVSFEGNLSINRLDFGVGEKDDKWIGKTVNINFMISCRTLNTDLISTLDHPVAKEIYAYIETNGIEKGIPFVVEKIKSNQEDKKVNKPQFLDFIGQRFVQYDQPEKAVKVYELNVALFPETPWTYSSLANGYFVINSKGKALENARKALELNDKDTQAIELIKQLNL